MKQIRIYLVWGLFFLLLSHNPASAQYIMHIAGNDSLGHIGDGGPAAHASLHNPKSICRDAAGNLYIGDGIWGGGAGWTNQRVRKINAATGFITTVAGGINLPNGDTLGNAPATATRLRGNVGICIDKVGNLLIVDYSNRVWKVNMATGFITRVAGTGAIGYSGDGGPATAAQLRNAMDVAADAANNIFVVDGGSSSVVRRIDAVTGIITTVVGTGAAGFSGDGGPATSAALNGPQGLYIDSADNLYIADAANNRVRKVSAATGIITTIAGSSAVPGFGGDGGHATAALFSGPGRVTMDRQGNLYIADAGNRRIRKVASATSIVTTFAGTGAATIPGGIDSVGDNGPATAAPVFPMGMCFDTCGNLYIGSQWGCRVRAITPVLPTNGKLCGLNISVGIATPGLPESEGELHLWPNPNSGSFIVNATASETIPARIIVTNVTGQRVKEITASTNQDIELQLAAPPGMYFVNLTTAKGRWNEKVMVR